MPGTSVAGKFKVTVSNELMNILVCRPPTVCVNKLWYKEYAGTIKTGVWL